MCGLCGFIVQNRKTKKDWPILLQKMTTLLAHRGPDSDGYHYSAHDNAILGFGHRRLSIIDLTKHANQPLGNEDNSILVVFNGEIYNFRELTDKLKNKGHIFRSNSDTEVIVHLFEDLRDNCVAELDGMFAFALFDLKARRLLLARDRVGMKPLYYAAINGNIYFASEIKSLLLIDEVTRELDLQALDCFFTYGYIPGTKTIFKDIKKLPPASYLTFENSELNIRQYWTLKYQPKNYAYGELKDRLYYLLNNAVRKHMVSDVPLGAFLSGGIDSSIVVAMMDKVANGNVSTFSLGFTEGGNDELGYAAAMSNSYQTNHHEIKVSPHMTSILPELLWHLDEPFFDNSIIPTYLISKFAKDKVKVVLSGDGGDELFGGYEWTRRHQYQMAYGLLPGFTRSGIKRLVPGKMNLKNEYGKDWISKVKRFFSDLNTDLETGFRRRTTVSNKFRNRLYSAQLKSELADFHAEFHQHSLFEQAEVHDQREKMLFVDTKSFLPDDCLYKVDRMSMANGLEVRIPYLDKELLEFSTKIPFNYKINKLTTKYILKETFAPHLPPKILKQRKIGFTIPISAWIRDGLEPLVESVLLSGRLTKRGLFEEKHIRWMVDSHKSGKQELGHRLWSLVVFEIWARLYLDEKVDSVPKISVYDMI